MNTEEIKNIINQYFDNELTKAEEVYLFTQLSQDSSARDYFKEMNSLRAVIDNSMEDYPQSLDEKIFSKLKRGNDIIPTRINRSRIFAAMSYGFAIILLALSFFLYNESIQYRNKLEVTSMQVNQQNQLIQVLYNSLPQAEVVEKVENEIIVSSQM